VEREEAQALVAAMERSSISQDNLPRIPGLTRELSEKTVTIHVQDEVNTIQYNRNICITHSCRLLS